MEMLIVHFCRFVEKGNLEVLLFTLQSRMRANNQRPYLPKEGKMIGDINRAWEQLEKAEHERELALKEELIRQEKLEQLAARFDRKAGMRETWLSENQRLVSQDSFGTDLASVEAATKKHEAIETDIYAYEERVQAVVAVATELEAEYYHDIDRINERLVFPFRRLFRVQRRGYRSLTQNGPRLRAAKPQDRSPPS